MGRIKLKHLIITLKRNHVLVSKNSFWRGNYTLPIFAIMITMIAVKTVFGPVLPKLYLVNLALLTNICTQKIW